MASESLSGDVLALPERLLSVDHLTPFREEMPKNSQKLSIPAAAVAAASPPVAKRPVAVVAPFAPAADAAIEKCIKDSWTRKGPFVLISEIGPYKIFSPDIERTAPNNELGSEVMGAFLTVLVQDFNRHSKEMAGVIGPSAMTNFWKGKGSELKLNPEDYKLLLGVINENNNWLLMVIFPSQEKSLLFDPLGESHTQIKKCLEVKRAFHGCNVSSVTVKTLPYPHQTDRSSSGVFTLKFAESILKGDEEIYFQTSDEELTRDRFAIAETLLRRTDDPSQRHHIYGEDDSDMLDLR